MSYPLSDEDSTDSESGIRFKTANTRDKFTNDSADNKSKSSSNDRDRYSKRRDENHSSSRHNSHRSHRTRSPDRSRARRDRSRSREYRDGRRKRSPESLNSMSSGKRNDDEHRRSEKSSRNSNREYDRSRSRGNSPDRAYSEKVRSSYDGKQDTKNTCSGYRSLSDDEVKRRKRHKSESDASESDKEASCSTSPYIEYLEYLETSSEVMPASYVPSSTCARRSSEEPLSSQERRRLRREVKSPNKAQLQEPVSPSYIEYLENLKPSPKQKNKIEKSPKKFSKQSKIEQIGPALPPSEHDSNSDENKVTACIGLELPPQIKKKSSVTSNDSTFGPTVPPHIKQNSESDDQYGPALPQQLKKQINSEQESDSEQFEPGLPTQEQQNVVNPDDVVVLVLTTHLNSDNEEYIIGPDLPPQLQEAKTSSTIIEIRQSDEDDDEVIRPILPNSKKTEDSESTSTNSPTKLQIIGPVLPPHLRAALLENAEKNTEIIQLEDSQTDSDDDVIGPLPAGYSGKNPAHTQLEERALQMKLDSLNQSKDDRTVREEWMLELPQVQAASLGLGPRQFRAKGVPDMSDRSSWTDTPLDKAKKKIEPPKIDIKREAELRMIKERDIEQQEMVEKHKKKKKRDKSLLDAHQEEYNKKKKKEQESGINERRPFNRDIDLKANRFDEAQKKAILKKAQLLDNRFSSGESKFL